MASNEGWFENWLDENNMVDKDQTDQSRFHQPFKDLEYKAPPKKKQKKQQKKINTDDSHLFKEWLSHNDLVDKDKHQEEEPINTPFKKKELKGRADHTKTEKFVDDKNLFDRWLNQNEVQDKDETLSSETIHMYPPDHIDAIKIDATIDLHKLTVSQALRMVEQFIYHCYRRNDHVLRVIHGKGNHSKGLPKVKLAVLQWFRTSGKGHIKYYREASKKHGGAGATIVWLK